MKTKILIVLIPCLQMFSSEAQTVMPGFIIPDTVCINTPFNIVNTTTGASNFYWSFCSANLNSTPLEVENLGNFGGLLNQPAFMDYVFVNNNYYGFVSNYTGGNLIRLDFGNSLLNTPTIINLGNFGGIIPSGIGAEGIQIVQNEGKWYAIIVGGYPPGGSDPRILKIEFGTDITNTSPVATNWGNLGGMLQPIDLHVFQENSNWYGITVNAENNTITRFSFGTSFDNPPTAVNLGNIGGLQYPTGLFAINDNGQWRVFITNAGDNTRTTGIFSVTRLDFGNSLLNTPTGINLGNPGNKLAHPRDLTIIKSCDQITGLLVNGLPGHTDLVRLDFNNDLTSLPGAQHISSTFDFAHSISKLFRVNEDVYGFVTDAANNTISRLKFSGCTNSNIPSSSAQNPSPVSYNTPGIYNINLTVDIGLPSQTSICKKVVVNPCYDSIIITNDTTICSAAPFQLRATPALAYQWTPSLYLDDAASASPTTSTPENITYYVDALVQGTNLIVNGDFSSGNAAFASNYNYSSTNISEGEYFVGNNPKAWNSSLHNCTDHTSGNGNMLLVNGSPSANIPFWSLSISVKPNTNYTLSSWLQALWPPSPASLEFSINGVVIGTAFTAQMPTCNWSNFYSIWNSGSSTTAKISIVNKNPDIIGNDFAMDDIHFSEAITIRDSITVKVKKEFIKANEDTTVCAGSEVPLQVAQGTLFTWSPSTGLSDTDIPDPVATPSLTTEYFVTGMTPGGCPAKDTVVISVLPKPAISISNDTLICKGSPVQLSASGGSIYQWSPTAGLNDFAIPDPVVSTQTDMLYKVKVTGTNNCSAEDSVKINILPHPLFTASGNKTICQGESVTLGASGGDTYQWMPTELVSDVNSPSISTTPFTSTVYTVNILENLCNYDTTIRLAVVVNPNPTVYALKSNDINCNILTAQLEATGGLKYNWTPSTGLDDPQTREPIASPDTTTIYQVNATNEFGCSSAASLTVTVDKGGIPRFVVPNAFSPNNDGRNDCFGIKRWGNAVVRQFSIFNRWGQIVFQTNNPSECWDGTLKGLPQSTGSYIYIINASTLCGEVKRKGMLTLIR